MRVHLCTLCGFDCDCGEGGKKCSECSSCLEQKASYAEVTAAVSPKGKSIWCLFYVNGGMYDQPENNLVTFWFSKPTRKQISKAARCIPRCKTVSQIMEGKDDSGFRLREVTQDTIKEEF